MTLAYSRRRDATVSVVLGGWAGVLSLTASRPQGLWMAMLPPLLLALWWVANSATRWVLALLAAAILLPPLPLPGGDTGPHPAVLIAALGLWAGLARLSAWRMRWAFLPASLLFLFFSLAISVPLAGLYSGWEIAAGSLARVALFAISAYVFFYIAWGPGREINTGRLVRVLFWAGLGSAGFACLDFYFQFPAPGRFAPQFVWLPDAVLRRAQGVFYEATTLGCFCVFLLVMIASIAALRLGRELRLPAVWLMLGAAVLLAALSFSFSRSAAASLAIALLALLWMERGRLRTTWKVITRGLGVAFCLTAAIAVVSWLFPNLLPIYFSRLWATGGYLFSSPDMVLAPRLESWSFLLKALAEKPWRSIFGVGYKTLPYSGFLGRPVVADNMYLSMLVETGWGGLAALLLFGIAVLRTTYRLAARGAGFRRLAGLWMFCFWCGQTVQMLSGDILTYWRLLPLYLAVLAAGVREP